MFKYILISQPDDFDGEIDVLVSLFENGLQYFHLRKPQSSKEEMIKYIESIPEKYHSKIVIHSHYSLAEIFNLKGIHCTAKGRDEFYEMEHLPIQKSISTHGFCEAGMVDESFAYAFISPVFTSISKPNYEQAFQHDALQQFLCRPHRTAFIALGGITPENVSVCKQMGFDGVAMIGSIWNHHNPLEQWEKMCNTAC